MGHGHGGVASPPGLLGGLICADEWLYVDHRAAARSKREVWSGVMSRQSPIVVPVRLGQGHWVVLVIPEIHRRNRSRELRAHSDLALRNGRPFLRRAAIFSTSRPRSWARGVSAGTSTSSMASSGRGSPAVQAVGDSEPARRNAAACRRAPRTPREAWPRLDGGIIVLDSAADRDPVRLQGRPGALDGQQLVPSMRMARALRLRIACVSPQSPCHWPAS